MEDRYLFRGKRIDNGEWVEGYLSYPFCTKKGNESYYFYAKDSLGFFCRCVVDASTICQCTGLKDKNGNLIWENDIANCIEAECCGRIVWNESEAGFYFDVLLEDETYEEEHIYDYVDCMDVIGNIFDNPELLESEE